MNLYRDITVNQVADKVRQLAEARPDFNYLEQEGASLNCSYLGAAIPDTMDWSDPKYDPADYSGEGCIVGQALTSLGVEPDDLIQCEANDARFALRALGIIPGSETPTLARWLNTVQQYQDNRAPWGEAVRRADEDMANAQARAEELEAMAL